MTNHITHTSPFGDRIFVLAHQQLTQATGHQPTTHWQHTRQLILTHPHFALRAHQALSTDYDLCGMTPNQIFGITAQNKSPQQCQKSTAESVTLRTMYTATILATGAATTIAALASTAIRMWRKSISANHQLQAIQEKCNDLASQLQQAQLHLEQQQQKLEQNAQALTQWQIQAQVAQTQLSELKAQQTEILQQASAQFKQLASEIVQNETTHLRQSSEQRIGELLDPLKTDISRFRTEVTNFYNGETAQRLSLQQQIKQLVETTHTMGAKADSLAGALRGNTKMQGDWGEMVLEQILQSSGLMAGEQYIVQNTHDQNGNTLRSDQGNRLRPDVTIHYPDGGVVVIDSKVSLSAFMDRVNATTPEQSDQAGQRHLESVTRHINELSRKNYQEYIGAKKLDFVMMFIPNESAYAAAMTLDPQLWQKAYDKRVLLVSPTQLIGALRLIQQLWLHDAQTRHAIEIADEAGKMYEKFVGFVTDMQSIERSLDNATRSYQQAMGKLTQGKGNLIGKAEKLITLGVKAKKTLPPCSPP